jgi:transglutaminase-like putative cysteine protease
MSSELCRVPGSSRRCRMPRAERQRQESGRNAFPRAALALAGLLAAAAAAVGPAAAAAAAAGAAPAEPWDGRFFEASPAELLAAATAAAAAGSPGSRDDRPVDMLFSEERFSFDEAGRLTHTARLVYRFRTANADPSWSEVGAGWLPWHQQRPRIRARVVTPDGQEHRLDPRVLEQSTLGAGDPEMFVERQLLRGPLPAVVPGAVVEEEETVADSAPAFERGTFARQSVGMRVPLRHARVVLEAPAGMPLRYVAELLPGVEPRREASGGRQRVTFEARDLPALAPTPPGLPPEAPRRPGVAFANAASWREIAEAYSRIVDQAIAGTRLESWLRAAGAGEAAPAQLDLVGRVLAQMAEIRYTGVELGDGGIVPRSPADTLARRFGDCKDKSVLLVAALRALEIPAYVALLAAGEDDRDVDPALPGFGAFDHAIVFVPGTPAIWIDPTDRYARLGELPLGDQGRYALVAAPGVTSLTRTPVSPSSENRVVKTREFFLADHGPARVVETTEYGGATERRQRAYLAAVQSDALRKALDKYAQEAFYAKGAASSEQSDPRDLSHALRVRLEVTGARRGYTDQANAVVAIFYSTLLDLLPRSLAREAAGTGTETEADDDDEDEATPAAGKAVEPRPTDYYLRLPHTVEVRYRIVLPAGFEAEDLPASHVRQLGTATFAESYATAEPGIVTASLRFDSGKQRLSPAELAALHSAVGQLAKDRVLMLRFRHVGESLAASGHIREAIDELRQESAAAPAKALPHQRMARTLLAGGLGEAARREAERAVQLEPRSAHAHATLGWVLQHDAIGRRFGQGFSRQQALAAYAKARQLDPSLTGARADYAILLEHSPSGQRYQPGCDLAAAIAEYRSLGKDFDDHDFDDNLLVDLLLAGRTDEALELAATMKQTSNKSAVTVAATALKRGPEAAVHEAEKSVGDSSQRLQALGLGAQYLMRLHAYPAAATLLERAALASPDGSKLATLAGVLRQARRLDQIPLPADQPSTVARRMFVSLASEPADLDTLLSLFSRRMVTAGDSQPTAATAAAVSNKLRKALGEKTGIPLDVAMEIGLAAMKETVSGDDQVGYRVHYDAQFGDASGEEVFVVRESGAYRIAASGHDLPDLGKEALRRLDAGDLRGVRQWLDWARELTREPAGDLPEPPFSALWVRGVAAAAEPARCAAAALAAPDLAEAAAPILRACRAAAQAEADQLALDLALAGLAVKAKRWPEVVELAERLGAARPRAERPFLMEVGALRELGRVPEAIELANRRLARLPTDRRAQLVLASFEEEKGDFDAAERRLRQLADGASAGAEELNDLAWLLLVRGRADEEALEVAQRASRRSEERSYSILHTLAAILAERNRPAEAYQTIVHAIAAEEDSAPGSVDWYVFGRMAEQYGLPEAARGLYQRVEQPQARRAEATSTFRLARARLAAIDGDRRGSTPAGSEQHARAGGTSVANGAGPRSAPPPPPPQPQRQPRQP